MNRIDYIESNGFRIRGRYIEKRSQSTRHYKVVGQLNDNNFFFFSDNVHPFKQGINSFKNTSIVDDGKYIKHIERVKENDRNDFNVKFEKYIETTKTASDFGTFLNKTTREFLNKNSHNYFDIRGVANGYMQDAVLFPFFDYDGNFVTAQIIKYHTNGKRVKTLYGTNWFHAYKPIKKVLGLKDNDKYSVPVKCFFGENYLNGSRNPVAIVEAPKTAVILKEFYPNIDWVATGGEQQLFNKDLSVLSGKDIVIFADAHTTKWKDFAEENKYTYCDILDIEGVEKGSDIADFIVDAESIVFDKLHNFIFSLNDRSFDFDTQEDDLELEFQVTGEEKNYLAVVPYKYKDFDIIHKTDNARDEDITFCGKSFYIYQNDYWVLNANIDFHKRQRSEDGKPVGFDEKEFVWHLQKCYRVLKSLNEPMEGEEQFPIRKIFKQSLKALLKHSNFSFNSYYVMNRLLPLWDSFSMDLTYFKKERNWKYKGGGGLTRDNFEKELNNDKFRDKLKMRLLGFKDAMEQNRIVLLETDLALSTSTRGYTQVKKLVKQWNKEVIGFSTLSTYDDKVNFQDDLEKSAKKLPPYIRDLIWGDPKITVSGISKAELYILMPYSQDKIKHILNFKGDRDTATIIQKEVDTLIENINRVEPVRLKTDTVTRITDFRYIKQLSKSEWNKKYNLSHSEAFPTKTNLIISMEKITDPEAINCYLNEIRYLTDMEARKIKSKEKRTKYLKYTEEELHTFIEKSNAKNKQPDKLLSIA